MSWSVLQSASSAGTSAATTKAVTFSTSNLSSGTKLLAYVSCASGASPSTSTVKDGAGNSFTKILSVASNGLQEVSAWEIDTPAGDVGIKPTITATFVGSAIASILVQEVSGLMTGTSNVDGTAGSLHGNGGTSTGSPTYSSSVANEFLVALYGDDGGPTTVTQPSGYTLDSNTVNSNGNADIAVGYKNSSGGSETSSWSLSGSAADWGVITFALKLAVAAQAGGPGVPYCVTPPGRMSPMVLQDSDWTTSTIQPVIVAGSFSLAPLGFSGAATYAQPQTAPPSPVQPPGLQSPAALSRIDWYPSQIEPITVTGSFSLAPLGFGGSAQYTSPAENITPSPVNVPPGLQSPMSLARVDWTPSQIEPVTVSGSFSLAPIGFSGTESETIPQPGPPEPLVPGFISPMSLSAPIWYPSQIEPVTVSGSFALAPLGFSGSGGPVPNILQQTTTQSELVPPGLRSPMALTRPDWTPSQPSNVAPVFSSRFVLAPLVFAGQFIYTAPPSAFVMPDLTVVQTTSGSAPQPADRVTITFNNPIGVTHGIIICVACNAGVVVSNVIGPDTFTTVPETNNVTSTILYCGSSVGGYSSFTVTVPNPGGGGSDTGLIVFAYEASGPITLDKEHDTNTNVAGAWTSGATATTTQNKELWIGMGAFQSSNSGDTITGPSSPWVNLTEIDSVAATSVRGVGALAAISGSQSVTSTGSATYSGNSTIGGTVQSNLNGVVATFFQTVIQKSLAQSGAASDSIVVSKSTTPSSSDSGVGSDSIGVGSYTYFPDNPLGMKFEILLNGTWTDITIYVYNRANIPIGRGRPNETSRMTQSTMSLTLDNRGGRFSPLNMMSPYFPFIGRNTQIRASLQAVSDSGAFYPPGGTIGYRFWGEVSEWPPGWDVTGTDVYANVVAGGIIRRYQQSQAIGSSLYRYYTSLQGSKATVAYWPCQDSSTSSQFSSPTNGVQPGTWSGSPQLSSGSSFAGSDALPSFNGSSWTFLTGITGTPVNAGSVIQPAPGNYVWQAPPGITSVNVKGKAAGGGGASPYNAGKPGGDFTFQGDATTVHAHGGQPGQPDFVIGTGGLGGTGGTGSSDPQHFDGGAGAPGHDNSALAGSGGSSAGDAARGTDAVIDGSGAIAPSGGGNGGNGGNGDVPPGNPPAAGPGGGGGGGAELLRTSGGTASVVTGGGGGGGEGVANPSVSVTPLQIYPYTVPAGGQGGPGINGGNGGNGFAGVANFSWSGSVASPVPANFVRFLLQIPAGGGIDGTIVARIITLGTVATAQVVYHTGGNLELIGFNSGGVQIFDTGSQSFGADGTDLIVSVELTISGSNVAYKLTAIVVGNSSAVASFTGTVAGGVGAVTEIDTNVGGTDTGSTVAGHFAVQYAVDTLDIVSAAANGHSGELAGARFNRLCSEQNIASRIVGSVSDTPAMGPQADDTFLNLMQTIEDADQGQVYEPRDMLGLAYRTRKSMQNQVPVAVVSYGSQQISPPFQPTIDDQLIKNDITATRVNGSSARAVLLSNPAPWQFNTQSIPAGNNYFILPALQAASINIGDTFTDVLNPGTVFAVTGFSSPVGGYVNVSFFPNAANLMVHPDIVTQNNVMVLTVQDPPAGVGHYSDPLTVDLLNDSQLLPLALWKLRVGSVNEYRYPQVTIDMARVENQGLFQYIPQLDIGSYFQIPDPPGFLVTSPVKQLVWGYTETMNNYTWTFQFNLVPESPYEGANLPTW